MVTRMLVGYGTSPDLILTSIEYYTSIRGEGRLLVTPNSGNLSLIGRIQGFTFLPENTNHYEHNSRYLSVKTLNKLKHLTLMILEDGRVFEKLEREHLEPSEITSARNYLNQLFGGRNFLDRFSNLYNQYKRNGK